MQREALSSKVHAARATHRREFKQKYHVIAALPIPALDKRKHYKALSLERKLAERKLRARIQRWRATSVVAHPRSWKEFLAARAARGDQRAIRRLRRQWRGLVIKSSEKQDRALPPRSFQTSRGSILHNLPGGVRLRESAGSLELVGDVRDEALEQLVSVAKQRFGSRCVKLVGRKDVQRRLARIAADQGLEITQERER